MKKTLESLRKSDRVKEFDPDILNDLKNLYGSSNWKAQFNKHRYKKKKYKKTVKNLYIDGVLGLASLVREADIAPKRAATHVTIAQSIQKYLNKQM